MKKEKKAKHKKDEREKKQKKDWVAAMMFCCSNPNVNT